MSDEDLNEYPTECGGVPLDRCVVVKQLRAELAAAQAKLAPNSEMSYRLVVANLRMLCDRIARQSDSDKRKELASHANRLASEVGCGANILRHANEVQP